MDIVFLGIIKEYECFFVGNEIGEIKIKGEVSIVVVFFWEFL